MKWGRTLVVVFSALAITALGIDAADTFQGARSTLLGQVLQQETAICPDGMTVVPEGFSVRCVDTYEASVAETCIFNLPASIMDSKSNIQDTTCVPQSVAGAMPWRFITRDMAQTACLQAGKRLPTSEEWYMFALGTPDVTEVCNTDSAEISTTGQYTDCQSAVGVHDAIGNMWEWTSDEVVQGVFNNRTLPTEGYVALVDKSGMAVETTDQPQIDFNNDYFWGSNQSVRAIMRGGFYGSGQDAGVYAAHTDVATDFSGAGIGFRCVL